MFIRVQKIEPTTGYNNSKDNDRKPTQKYYNAEGGIRKEQVKSDFRLIFDAELEKLTFQVFC